MADSISIPALSLWHEYRILILGITGLLVAIFYQLWASQGTAHPPNTSKYVNHDLKPGTAVERESLAGLESSKIVKTKSEPKRIAGRRGPSQKSRPILALHTRNESIQPVIFFSSLGGSTEARAETLCARLNEDCEELNKLGKPHNVKPAQVLDLSYIEYDDYFTALPKSAERESHFYIILIPTYNIDTNLANFLEHLRDTHHDFRVDTAPLRNLLGYSVFGFGDKEEWPTEGQGFCTQAVEVDKWMARLTEKKRAYPLGVGNVKSQDECDEKLSEWRLGIQTVIADLASGHGLGQGVPGAGDAVESEDEDHEDEKETDPRKKRTRGGNQAATLDDMENLGSTITTPSADEEPLPIDFTTYNKTTPLKPIPTVKEMVPQESPTYAALTKQGYSIVGSHSGIKLCRWTKSALRGRGSCYKHSFYGIASHCCMECTPSLSCSNKCVFCWRHGTNPVGTSWRWQVDAPETIFEGVTREHVRKIKTLRGVPGVRAERFEEAMRIRHCALSLVGEPIFYPHINEFLGMLHSRQISSFLVCNAQHPAQLAALHRVTQLYVSIDAADAETLRKIDRPLHRDFWERFISCLDILREARFRQRTVFRLTLVKGFNLDEAAAGYAALVQRGLPCFVEVKGVTYCGTSTSKGAGLSMANVPFYEEVVAFVETLNRELASMGLEYGIGAEHAHSCCILLASRRFFINEAWHTSIDYERFFRLLEGDSDFRPEDYCARTVDWALWGNGGFDPADVRMGKKGKAVKSVVNSETDKL